MRAVARLLYIKERDHEAGPLIVSSDAARRLDILGMGLRLTQYNHEPEALNDEERQQSLDNCIDLLKGVPVGSPQ